MLKHQPVDPAACSNNRWLPARGSCLGAQVPTGSRVLVEPFGDEPPRLGELAAYLAPRRRLFVHRLCRRDAGGWWASPDARLYAERTGPLIGRVRWAENAGRRIHLPARPARARLSWLVARFYRRLAGRGPRGLRRLAYRLLRGLVDGPLSSPTA